MELVSWNAVHVHVLLVKYVKFSSAITVHSSLHIIIPLTQDGATPLFFASQEGHRDVVNMLIRNGADIYLALNVQR